MLDPAIIAFFDERKKNWLKENTKTSMTEKDIKILENECEQKFSLEKWLPNAAIRANQISMATHPCTLSHPSARKNSNGYVTPVIAEADKAIDGFLKSGNVSVETDALGNAAALDVYKFLTLEIQDGLQLVDHIRGDTQLAKTFFKNHANGSSYQELRDGFLSMVDGNSGEDVISSSKIKQVYFPLGDNNYHQLSLLTNSGILFELRKRIDATRFSDVTKETRDLKKKNEFSKTGYLEISNITTIGYGGTKPQNISVLNNANAGKAHLLSSMPPTIEQRNIHFPKTNFFIESHHYYESREIYYALHKILKTNYNNIKIRDGRDYRLQELLDRIVGKMWAVRGVADSQYFASTSKLKKHQQVWLCNEYKEEREEEDQWLSTLCKEISRWILLSYERILGKQALKLGAAEFTKINEVVEKNKEALR